MQDPLQTAALHPEDVPSSRWVAESTGTSCVLTLDSLKPCQKALAQQLGKKNKK